MTSRTMAHRFSSGPVVYIPSRQVQPNQQKIYIFTLAAEKNDNQRVHDLKYHHSTQTRVRAFSSPRLFRIGRCPANGTHGETCGTTEANASLHVYCAKNSTAPEKKTENKTHTHASSSQIAAGENKQMGATITNVGHGSQKCDEMNSLAVSYLGKPLHFLASLLWAMLSRFLSLFIRNKEVVVDQATTTFDKPAPPAPRKPRVRLKNLPQVSGRVFLSAAEVRTRSLVVVPRVCRFNSGTL